MPAASAELRERLLRQTERLALEAELAECEGPHRIMRGALVGAVGVVSAAVALAITAFAVGGEPEPLASGENWPSVSALAPEGGHELSGAELASLDERGWECPGLEKDGLSVESARGYRLDGVPTVVLRLGDGTRSIAVMEQRPLNGDGAGNAESPEVLASDFPVQTTAAMVHSLDAGQSAVPADAWQIARHRLERGFQRIFSTAGAA